MADLSLRHIYKVYPNGTKAVSDFNMEIKDKEFIVFVGPSGCGKSTTLRMIAGLEDISAGELFIGGKIVNNMEPKDRDIAMVFQNYALYPHMTVYDNMAFGLKLKHVPAAEIHEKILWAANILGITEYLDRKPRAMSGGQRQRVALGRAILRNPKVFLLDEPLSNLDAKLRTQMRAEISKLHKQLGTTFIYVTHDQTEAMTMGTRIVVMKLGRVQQIDTPKNLYNYPGNKFVAGFIGTPQMNFFEATLKRNKDVVEIRFEYCDDVLKVPFNDLLKVQPAYFNGKKKVYVGLRCENISVDPEVVKKSDNVVKIKVSHFEELGSETLIYADLNMQGDGYVESSTRVIVKATQGYLGIHPGDVIDAAFDVKHLHFFDTKTEDSIMPRIPQFNLFDASTKDGVLSLLGLNIKLPEAIKVNDYDDLSLLIPSKAIKLGEGNIQAKISNIEVINDTRLVYLEINNRIFFTTAEDDKYKIGEIVNISIDFTKISLEKDEEVVVKPLAEFDKYTTGFTSAASIRESKKVFKRNIKEIVDKYVKDVEAAEREELHGITIDSTIPKILKEEYKEKIGKIKAEAAFNLEKGDLGKDGKKKIKVQLQEDLAEEKKQYEAKLADYNAQVEKLNKRSSDQVAKDKAAEDEIRKKYEAKVNLAKNLHAKFEEGLSKNDNWMLEDSKNDITSTLVAMQNVKQSGLEAKHARVAEDKKNISEAKARKEDINNVKPTPVSEDEKIYDEKNEAYNFALRQGYIMLNGYYLKVTEDIESKIIQALGVRTFTSLFRLEVSHDAYRIQDYGVEAKVEGYLNYGTHHFIVANALGNVIYIESDQKPEVGSTIHLGIDLKKCRIFESKFDIRLY